ncbi:MAG: hypothetical protein ABI718_03285 [Acidobacteriota bacterium]
MARLASLRRVGLVADRREGKWIHYRLTPPSDPAIRSAFDAALHAMQSDPAMRKDRKKLRACCSPRAAGILRRAPKPGLGTKGRNAAP